MKRTRELNDGWQFAAADWLDASGAPCKLGFSRHEWLPARVPGHVHLDLVRHGIIADPFAARAELGCQWVDEQRWVFETAFELSIDPALPRRVLRFDGIDTVCSVVINGQPCARHDNMFVPLEIDVTEVLVQGDNRIRVEIEPAARVGRERRARYLEKEGLPDDVARFDERAFVRKAQYMFAWDWGPRLVSAGLWRGVSLIEHAGRLLDVHVTQQHLANGSVELKVHSRIEGEGTVVHLVQGPGIAGAGAASTGAGCANAGAPPGAAWLPDAASLVVERPALWWPAGLGEQTLYRVQSFLLPSGDSCQGDVAERALDRRDQRVGLRRSRLLRERDAQGESFELEVNGVRLYALGANWIPDSSFPSSVDRSRILAQARRALDMNMNMLRVWGGGLYESDEFYDVCDELGLLVWQDFPFACSYVPDDEPEQASLRREATANIERLRNHPSLVLWCGNNENLTMWHSKWGRPAPQPGRYYGEKLYEGTLPELLAVLDPERPYVASSPIGGDNANDGDIGDQHYWDVWHGRGDYVHYADSRARFASEFGFASAPGCSVWRKTFPGDPEWSRRDARDPIARWHDKTGKGYDTFLGYIELHYPAARDLEEHTYHSQLNQRDALRFGIEHYRRVPGCRGSLIWQLNDCWPVQSWAVLDSDGVYKAAAYELRRLYAPAHHGIEFRVGADSARLWTVLDNSHGPVCGEARLEARRLSDGALLQTWTRVVELHPGDRQLAIEARVDAWPAADTLLVARFLDGASFRLLAEPKDACFAAPRLRVSAHAEGLLVRSDRPVVDLFLWDPEGQLELADNFITLPAAGERVVRARGRYARLLARSLAGRHVIE